MSIQRFNQIKILGSLISVLGVSCLIAFPSYSQSIPPYRSNINLDGTTSNEPIIRITPGITPGMSNSDGRDTYPYGSRINGSGIISSPQGQVTLPNVRVNNGDGSTTYYYQNGSSITIDKTKLPGTGAPLR
jgi:hypothetical protein